MVTLWTMQTNRQVTPKFQEILKLVNDKTEPDRIFDLKPGLRFLLLSLANVLILVHLYLLLKKILTGISDSNYMQQMACLMYWDILIFLVCISGVIFLATLIIGRTRAQRDFAGFPSMKFVSVFFLVAFAVSAIFVLAPNFLFDAFFFHESKIRPGRNLTSQLPGRQFLLATLVTGMSLGFDWANRAEKGRSLHWLLVPILIIPIPFFNLFPLMWWHAGNFLFKSKVWNLWRPILVMTNCFLPVLFYPISQPIRPDLPAMGKGSILPIGLVQNECDGYFAEWVDRRPEFYLSCDHMFYRIAKDEKLGSWRSVDNLKLQFKVSLGALDQGRGVGYLFNGYESELNIIALPELEVIEKRAIPLRAFPGEFEMPFHAIDTGRQRLFLADPNGLVSILDLKEKVQEKYQSEYFNKGGPIARMIYDEKSDLLYLLKAHRLLVLRSEDLRIIREIEIEQIAAGFVIDPEKERIYISLPRQMKVRILDIHSLKTIGEFDAPAACRFLAVDMENRLLFITSMSGVVETRNLKDLTLLRRDRLSPWIHNVSVNPKLKKAVVTVAENFPFIFSYSSKAPSVGFSTKSMQWFENLLRISISRIPIGKERLEDGNKSPIPRGNKTVLILLKDKKERELARGILEWGGYRVRDTGTVSVAGEILLDPKNRTDVVIADVAFSSVLESIMAKPEAGQRLPIIFSISYAEAMKSEQPEKYLVRPFELAQMLSGFKKLLDEAQENPDRIK